MDFSRKTKLKSNLIISTLIIIGIIIAVNIISYRFFYRLDLTENKQFTISETTKNILKNLNDIINIKVFFSAKLPPRYISTSQEVKDILAEYQNFSKNKLNISYVDPKDNADLQTEARRLGIPELQFNIMEKDQFQVTQGYLGLAVIYGDKKEVLPVIEDTNNLEYQLTVAIKKATASKIGKIGFVKGHDEGSIETEGFNSKNFLAELLTKQYDVVSIDTTNGELVADDIDTLVINGPKKGFSDRELFTIDQFLMKGKSVLFLVDGANIGEGLSASANETNLEKLLINYGINLEKNLVLDVSNDIVSFNSGNSVFFAQYPFWVRAVKDNFDKNNAIVSRIETLLFPWASSISLNKDIIGDNNYSELVKSSAQSWEQKDKFNMDPTQRFTPPADSLKQFTLAVAVSGKFKSYFADKNVPPKDGEKESNIASAEKAIESTDNGRIIVVGDSDFITEGTVRRAETNALFFQNAIDSLTQDENLSSIRAKSSSDRPIKDTSDQQKTTIKFVNILGVSLVVIGLGVIRFLVRRREDAKNF